MGSGSSAVRRAGGTAAVPTIATTSAAVMPLSSVEHVDARLAAAPAVAAPPATPAEVSAAPTPVPPSSGHTSNPRQRLKDPHVVVVAAPPPLPRTAANAGASITTTNNNTATTTLPPTPPPPPPPHRHVSELVEMHSPPATPPADGSAPPPAVAETVMRMQRDDVRPAPPAAAATSLSALFADAADGGDADGCRRSSRGTDVATNLSLDDDGEEEEERETGAPRCDGGGEAERRSGSSSSGGGGGGVASVQPSPSPDAPATEEEDEAALAGYQVFTAAGGGGGGDGGVPSLLADVGMTYRPVARSASPGPALVQYAGLPLAAVQEVLESKHRVYRICLTGGPCAGKSTMLSAIQARIPQRTGFRVMCVPEAATLLVTGGMQWDGRLAVPQQLALLRTQLSLEDQFYALATASGVPTIVVSDRGTMDGRAFCTEAQFHEILRGVGSTVDVLRDRYDAVIHMVTAANGAEEFYNLDNPARYEDLAGARASDLRLQEMYVGHPMFRLLDNTGTFEEKIERGLQVVCQVVHKDQSAPASPTHYLVRRCPAELPVACATYTTYTTVLSNSRMGDVRLLVRREMADGSTMHFFKSIRESQSGAATVAAAAAALSSRSTPRATSHTSGGASSHRSSASAAAASAMQQRIESAQRISSREYASLRRHCDTTRAEVVMEATHFIFDGANYELTTLLAPRWAAGRQTLTVESRLGSTAASAAAAPLQLPPFLVVDREVPVESLTTAFLISHCETGPLYTSLAFAPVFSRAVVTALGAHADTQNILNSTLSTPRGTSVLHPEASTHLGSPVAAAAATTTAATAVERDDNVAEPAPTAPHAKGDGSAVEEGVGEAPSAVPPPAPPPPPIRRGLAPLNVNALPNTAATAKADCALLTGGGGAQAQQQQQQQQLTHLGDSCSIRKRHDVVTPSRFSLSGEEEAGDGGRDTAGEHPQPERVLSRDPESLLPPIGGRTKRPVPSAGHGS
ncbi:AAA domain containing protein [Novymonas esmeraldas]|uniref:AAA domain containing protein n=1 Tax=Novymonas esmeraldas TaxID=1808958 RepID=A0AAW0EKU1_9TRYP